MINSGYIFKKFIVTEILGLSQFWSSIHQLSRTGTELKVEKKQYIAKVWQ